VKCKSSCLSVRCWKLLRFAFDVSNTTTISIKYSLNKDNIHILAHFDSEAENHRPDGVVFYEKP
jgi:hypothetical protein